MKRMTTFFALIMAAGLVISNPSAAQAGATITAGTLRCDVDGGIGFVFGSSRDLECSFIPAGSKTMEKYSGTIDNYGVDIGYTAHSVILWGVVSANKELSSGELAGTYNGISADATLGLGAGVKVLALGGDEKGKTPKVALQPLSVQGNKGLNVAAGISRLTLQLKEAN